MKFLQPLLITLFLLLSGFIFQQASAQSVELSEKLEEFSQVYDVYFSYDAPALKGIKTDFQINKEQAVKEALTAMLEPLQIRYNAIGKQFFVLEKTGSGKQNRFNYSGQWSFILLDDTNLAPVMDAFIFGENSSIGTTTTEDGKAILSTKKLGKVKLVLTHINYETLTIPAEDLRTDTINLIFMTPKAQDLDEVVVGAKKRNQRKRKQWMRKFENAFFGETNRKNRVELLNPEVVWFEEKDTILQAQATDYLSLINKSTGYKMRFFLDDFKIFDNEDVKWVGQLFFEDISADLKNQRRINKRRDKNYLNSKNLFFKSLAQELPINGQRFEFGVTVPTDN
ncbi:MAG: carboxypeptidase-like regulatory domain-containing protein, partial [Bacteroidota bacterium]